MSRLSFKCYQCDEDDCKVSDKQLSVCETVIFCWKSSLREYDGSLQYARGCIDKIEHIPRICSNKMQSSNSQYRTECCPKDFCNGGVFPLLDDPDNHRLSLTKQILVILGVLLIIGLIMLTIYYYLNSEYIRTTILQHERRLRCRIGATSRNNSISHFNSFEMRNAAADDSTAKEHLDSQSLASGSSQRNLSKHINLVEHLSEGYFGMQQHKLWRGIWKGESVMVKIYSSGSEEMWTHETEVYTKLLRSKHNNILEYVGSEKTSVASDTQLWLVTYYQTNGSLVNYLKEARLNRNGVLKTCLSLTQGLLYLHTEKSGTKGKLAMAHRNLSSNNIFVNKDGVCVIGGFECVATQERLGEANFLKLASKRYMSPELLEPTFEHEIWSLEGFQQADMYSMSLIFWEICRMCVESKDDVSNYVAAFSEWLTNDEQEPTIEAMRKLILVDRRRPKILDQWRTDPVMNVLGSMIEECWNTKTTARWSILRVKKTLLKLTDK